MTFDDSGVADRVWLTGYGEVYRCISTKMEHTTTIKALNFGCTAEGEEHIFLLKLKRCGLKKARTQACVPETFRLSIRRQGGRPCPRRIPQEFVVDVEQADVLPKFIRGLETQRGDMQRFLSLQFRQLPRLSNSAELVSAG